MKAFMIDFLVDCLTYMYIFFDTFFGQILTDHTAKSMYLSVKCNFSQLNPLAEHLSSINTAATKQCRKLVILEFTKKYEITPQTPFQTISQKHPQLP